MPSLYMPSRNLPMISMSLFRFTGPFGARCEVIPAGVMIGVLPTLLIFLALQCDIDDGFSSGATKWPTTFTWPARRRSQDRQDRTLPCTRPSRQH